MSEGAAGLFVGIDIGATKVAGAVVRFPEATVVVRETVATGAERGGESVLADVGRLVDYLVHQARAAGEIRGVGAGVCELVDAAGNITSSATVDWDGGRLRRRLSRVAPAVVEADVRAASLAESRWGAARGAGTAVYVNVGSGISSSIVIDGAPLTGARGNALVLGSSPIVFECPSCGEMVEATLEEVASGPAFVRRYNAASPPTPADGAEEVLARAARGDTAALRVVVRGARALGSAVGWLVNVVDPDVVVVGGGLGLAGGRFWEETVTSTRRSTWAPAGRSIPMMPAALGADAGIVGAAAVAWTRLEVSGASG